MSTDVCLHRKRASLKRARPRVCVYVCVRACVRACVRVVCSGRGGGGIRKGYNPPFPRTPPPKKKTKKNNNNNQETTMIVSFRSIPTFRANITHECSSTAVVGLSYHVMM